MAKILYLETVSDVTVDYDIGAIMSVIIQSDQQRSILLGTRIQKSTGTLAATTIALFTVSGLVAVTSFIGQVTADITVANSYKLQHNPSVGTTADLFAATDIGTTDTLTGDLLGFTGVKSDSLIHGPGRCATLVSPLILSSGSVESVSAGTDGTILWILTYVPLDNGASIVAA